MQQGRWTWTTIYLNLIKDVPKLVINLTRRDAAALHMVYTVDPQPHWLLRILYHHSYPLSFFCAHVQKSAFYGINKPGYKLQKAVLQWLKTELQQLET